MYMGSVNVVKVRSVPTMTNIVAPEPVKIFWKILGTVVIVVQCVSPERSAVMESAVVVPQMPTVILSNSVVV